MSSPDTPPVFRFAPSPNGRLHLGHAYSALLNAELAAKSGGRFLIRIEDIDAVRCTPELVEACLDDLAWLGLTREQPVRHQSQHMPAYREALGRLIDQGLAYPCTCSRAQIAHDVAALEMADGRPWPRDPDGSPLYPGTCRDTPRGLSGPVAWRLDMARALASVSDRPLVITRFDPEGGSDAVPAEPARWGDVVIARRDIGTSYHLAVVVDDALQGVSHVARGQDLEAASDIHVLLQRLLGLPSPLYFHHRLILDDGGEKLAKSRASQSIAELRAAGWTPERVRGELGFN